MLKWKSRKLLMGLWKRTKGEVQLELEGLLFPTRSATLPNETKSLPQRDSTPAPTTQQPCPNAACLYIVARSLS